MGEKIDVRLPDDLYEWVVVNSKRKAMKLGPFIRMKLAEVREAEEESEKLKVAETARKYHNTISQAESGKARRKAAGHD